MLARSWALGLSGSWPLGSGTAGLLGAWVVEHLGPRPPGLSGPQDPMCVVLCIVVCVALWCALCVVRFVLRVRSVAFLLLSLSSLFSFPLISLELAFRLPFAFL